MKIILLSVLFVMSSLAGADNSALKYLPVQDAGRIKPFDSFARETLQLVYGKKSFKGKKAYEVVFTWMLAPEHWSNVKLIQIRHNGLREALGIKSKEVYYSPQSLVINDRVGLVMQELGNKREKKEKLNPYFQAVQKLENQLSLFHGIRTGQALRIVPVKNSSLWGSAAQLQGELLQAFSQITRSFIATLPTTKRAEVKQDVSVESAVKKFKALAQDQAPELYSQESKISVEVHYNGFQPFMWSWILYLLGTIFLIFARYSPKPFYYKMAWMWVIAGFLMHAYGMGLRVYLTGRPPVSNMYETVIWVPWGAILFAMILEKMQKTRLVLFAASVIATFCLILSDLSPTVLDGSLQPLEPVLRDNFWLLTHVLIITLSYAAFFLAFVLGDINLYYFLRGEKKYADKINSGVKAIYRSLQIGVVLLAAGTILGGVWADYSWGRFWGWDPKETWALIALLGYLAVLHGRLVGWLRSFGLSVGAVLSFSLVIMAWYGVNFVLGAGLHTYGFGAGGVEYVSGFVALHLLYVVYVFVVRQSRLSACKKN